MILLHEIREIGRRERIRVLIDEKKIVAIRDCGGGTNIVMENFAFVAAESYDEVLEKMGEDK